MEELEYALDTLSQFPGYDRVVFGSDFPHAPAGYTAETVEALRTYFEQDDAAYAAIEREKRILEEKSPAYSM